MVINYWFEHISHHFIQITCDIQQIDHLGRKLNAVQTLYLLAPQFSIYHYIGQRWHPSQTNAKKLSILQHLVQMNPSQLRSFIRKASNSQVITVVCECWLKVVNGNVPVSIPKFINFEETYINLNNPKTSLKKNQLLFWLNKDFI